MRHYLFLILVTTFFGCQDAKTYTIETAYGNMKIKLLDSTPKHSANFDKLVKEGFYDDLLFHRVIKGFMIQGGDPESKTASMETPLGSGGPGYNIPAEIGTPHFKGMISAARLGDGANPQKESSGSQFFIVEGNTVTDDDLNNIEHTKRIKYTPAQREKYKKLGGSPMLDNDYTVFGEVIEGIDVIEKITAVPADPRDRPSKDIRFKIK